MLHVPEVGPIHNLPRLNRVGSKPPGLLAGFGSPFNVQEGTAGHSALHALFVARAGHQGAARKESKGQLVSYATISPDLMIVGSVPTMGVRLRAQF
ncbi:MAG TPA: hypothetical protein VF856_05620 [Gemmatimonadaceae bacterium]